MRYQYLKAIPVFLLGLSLVSGCSDKKKPAAAPAPAAKQAEAKPAEAPKPKEPAAELKLKWDTGKRYVIRDETTTESSMKAGNQPEPVKTSLLTARDLALTVLKERSSGGQEIEIEFLAEKVENKMGDRTIAAFNSTDDLKTDRTNAIAKLHRKLVGTKFTLFTDTAGQVEKVEGVSNLVRKITLGLDKNSSTLLKAQFSEDALKKMGLGNEGMPKQAVAPGDSWTNQFDLPLMGGMVAKFTVQSSLKGYEEREKKRCAIIKNTGSAQISAGTTPQAGAMQFENVKLEGETVIDPEKSQLISANNEIKMEMKVTAGAQQNIIPVSIKATKAIVSVSDAKPVEAKTEEKK